MPIVRPACAKDLERAGELVVGSMNDLSQRHGFGPMAVVRPPIFSMFSLGDDPDGLWVAEEAGDILGFAFSWVCDHLWFLAQLFVSPDQQGKGIGQELLRRALEHAEARKAATRALITFTFNSASQGLYIRNGLFPRFPIYNFNVTRESLIGALQAPPLRCVRLKDVASDLHHLDQIDARALGVSRGKHHRFLISDSATKGVLLYAKDQCVGYAYVSAEGHIGPLAVTRLTSLGDAFVTALSLAAESGSSQVSAFIPATCEAALSTAVILGMRISIPMLLMSTRDFGNWEMYLPRNPGFM